MSAPQQYHAYTDYTDWIIGTSLEEALAGYMEETGLFPEDMSSREEWVELKDDAFLSINDEEAPGGKRVGTVRELIDDQLRCRGDGTWCRLLCSTEY